MQRASMERIRDSAEAHLGRMAATQPTVRMPTVAAIVCNFNQGAYVAAAIASVVHQTYPYLECVVVDDCSTDGSAEVIARVLAEQSTKTFRFIRHETNCGQMAAMLSGLDATTAPFVAWLDADDVWLPEYIERHVAHHLNSQVIAALSTSNMAVIDAGDTIVAGADPTMSTTSPIRKWDRSFPIRPTHLRRSGEEIDFQGAEPDGPVFINRHYESWAWSPTSGMVFRRAVIDTIRPPHTEGLRTSADHYLARFSHIVGGTIWMGETLGCYRVHGNNGFAKNAVRGDTHIGVQPPHITEEGNYQFVQRLAESKVLVQLLHRHNFKRLLVEIGRGRRAIRAILANKAFRRRMRPKDRLRLMRRYIAGLLGIAGYTDD